MFSPLEVFHYTVLYYRLDHIMYKIVLPPPLKILVSSIGALLCIAMYADIHVDTMDKWDEDKLKEVVKKKQNKPKTGIVSGYFMINALYN